MNVTILSGIPGSGKTTWIHRQADLPRVVCSADDYHVGPDGVYRFDARNLQAAHDRCLTRFIHELQNPADGRDLYVDNTNLAAWEIAPYYRLAQLHRFDVQVVRVWCDPLLAARRNVHGVPVDRVYAMYQTQLREVFPDRWKVRTVLAEG